MPESHLLNFLEDTFIGFSRTLDSCVRMPKSRDPCWVHQIIRAWPDVPRSNFAFRGKREPKVLPKESRQIEILGTSSLRFGEARTSVVR